MRPLREEINVALAWSGHPVRFQLITTDSHQYVAFYNHCCKLTVCQRARGTAPSWQFKTFYNEELSWDSHCNITMAMDCVGNIHLACNTHNSPLRYYRTSQPGNIMTLDKAEMVDVDEHCISYPRLFKALDGSLVCSYRAGLCGYGDIVINRYQSDICTWKRGGTIFDGEGVRSCYYVGGEGGHMAFCWRRSTDPRSNYSLGYTYSPNFQHFYKSTGELYKEPIRLGNMDLVWPVPKHGGMLNGNMAAGYDVQGRPVVSYHKFDTAGNTQIYNVGREAGIWHEYQMTNWDFRWDFSGKGTIPARFKVHPLLGRFQGKWEVSDDMRIIGSAPKIAGWRLEHRRGPANNDQPVEHPMKPQMLKVVWDD